MFTLAPVDLSRAAPDSIRSPPNRHELFTELTRRWLKDKKAHDRNPSRAVVALDRLLSPGQVISRTARKSDPTIWSDQNVRRELIALRQSCAISSETRAGLGFSPNLGLEGVRAAVEHLLLRDKPTKRQISIDELSFDDIIQMREDPGLSEAQHQLSLPIGGLATDIESTRLALARWRAALVDAADRFGNQRAVYPASVAAQGQALQKAVALGSAVVARWRNVAGGTGVAAVGAAYTMEPLVAGVLGGLATAMVIVGAAHHMTLVSRPKRKARAIANAVIAAVGPG